MTGASRVIRYASSRANADDFIDVLRRSTLAERRPVMNRDDCRHVGARRHHSHSSQRIGLLVGVSRAITDYHYCTYLSDLAVDVDYQRQGIGRELIRRRTKRLALGRD